MCQSVCTSLFPACLNPKPGKRSSTESPSEKMTFV